MPKTILAVAYQLRTNFSQQREGNVPTSHGVHTPNRMHFSRTRFVCVCVQKSTIKKALCFTFLIIREIKHTCRKGPQPERIVCVCVLTRASGRVSPVSCDVMMLPFLNNKNIASPKSSSPQTILKIVFPSPYKTVGRGPAVGKCDTPLQYHISMAFLLP